MKKDDLERILERSKLFAKSVKYKEYVKSLSQMIGDRRIKDLLDALLKIESSHGWDETLGLLEKAVTSEYSVPAGFGRNLLEVEPLKSREVIFSVFDCTGFEPVDISTQDLLNDCRVSTSYLDAKNRFAKIVYGSAKLQFQDGDSLFFQCDHLPTAMCDMIEKSRRKEIHKIKIPFNGSRYHVDSLWHVEYGRQALIETGTQGSIILQEEFDNVLLVLRLLMNDNVTLCTNPTNSFRENNHFSPTNYQYSKLLDAIKTQNLDELQTLGSMLGVDTLIFLTRTALSTYLESQDSESYGYLLNLILCHVKMRSIYSIAILEELINSNHTRIVAPAISALGNFYHPSSIHALFDFLCSSKDKVLLDHVFSALNNLRSRTLETDYLLRSLLRNSNCIHSQRLIDFLKEK